MTPNTLYSVFRLPQVKKSSMDFILRVLEYSLYGEITQEWLSPYEPPVPKRFFFSDEDIRSVQTADDAWDLLETGIELWRDIVSCYETCESLDLMLEATTEQHVIVASCTGGATSRFCHEPERLHVSYLHHTTHDKRFDDVQDHREWMTVAHRIVTQYVFGLSQRIEAAKKLFEVMVIDEAIHSPTDGHTVPGRASEELIERASRTKTPQEAAFESVRDYFLSSSDEVLRVIRSNEGTIRLKGMLIYEAAILLRPLMTHFRLNGRRLYNAMISVEGIEPFRWFGKDRRLYYSLKSYKSNYKSNGPAQDLIEKTVLFARDLNVLFPDRR